MTSTIELNHFLTRIFGLTPEDKLYVSIEKHLLQYSQVLDVKIEHMTLNSKEI